MSQASDTEKLRQRNRELSILNVIAQALNREINLAAALSTTLAQVAELFDLRTGWIWLLNEETGAPYLAASHKLPPALANAPTRMEGSCYCLDTYAEGDMDGAANVSVITCTRLKGLVDDTDGLRYHSSVPLYAHGKRLGILNVASADWRELSPDDLRLLYTIGDLLSIAVERARLFARSTRYGASEERNRLAREIHDTLAQGLSAITLQLETADALIEAGADPARARRTVQQALTLTRANLEEARRSVLDLRAALLEGRTLAEALPDLIASLTAGHDLTVHWQVVGADRPLPPRLEAGLYRIAQEAISNVVQHAQAENLTVTLTGTPDRVSLVVDDDGQGFDPTQVPKGRFGLIGLNERAHLLGGTLALSSQPNMGTRIEVTVPMESGG